MAWFFACFFFFTQKLDFFTRTKFCIHRIRAGYVFNYTVCLFLEMLIGKDKVYFHKKRSEVPNVFKSIQVNRQHSLQSLFL